MSPFSWPLPGFRAILSSVAPGIPVVMESEPLVPLYFDSRGVRCTMLSAAPDVRALGYSRTMMGFLLQPAPRHICMIGLGGGSLTKYCYRHLPDANITVIEINPEVIALRDQFCMPPGDERHSVVCADAVQYLSTTTQAFDALLLDGLNADGMPPELSDAAFCEACHSRLNGDGVMAATLSGEDPRHRENLIRIRETFGLSVALAPAEDSSGNIIAFGWKNGAPRPPLEALMMPADQHARQDSVDLVEAAARIEIGAGYDWTRQGVSNSA